MTIITEIEKIETWCIVRESNPGRPRGRRTFYHWTNDASVLLVSWSELATFGIFECFNKKNYFFFKSKPISAPVLFKKPPGGVGSDFFWSQETICQNLHFWRQHLHFLAYYKDQKRPILKNKDQENTQIYLEEKWKNQNH